MNFEMFSVFICIPVDIMSGPPAEQTPVVEGVTGEVTEPTLPPVGPPGSGTAEGSATGSQAGGANPPPAAGASQGKGGGPASSPSIAVAPGGPLRPAMTPPPDVVAAIKAKGGGLNLVSAIA